MLRDWDNGNVTTNTLCLWLVTADSWLRGKIMSRHRRLLEVLNTEMEQLATLHEVEVRARPDGAPLACAPMAGVSLANALFVIPLEEGSPPAPADSLVVVQKTQELTVIGIGPYILMGNLHLPSEGRLENYFALLPRRYHAMTKVRLSDHDDRELGTFDTVLINGRWIDGVLPAAARPGG